MIGARAPLSIGTRFRRFFALPAERKRTFLTAIAMLVGVRIALWAATVTQVESSARQLARRTPDTRRRRSEALRAARASHEDRVAAVVARAAIETGKYPQLGSVALALWAQAQGRALARELTSAGIPVLMLKGPELQARLYGTPAAYQSGDVDVLVPRERADRARRVLEAHGWAFARENGVLWRVADQATYARDGFWLDLHLGLQV